MRQALRPGLICVLLLLSCNVMVSTNNHNQPDLAAKLLAISFQEGFSNEKVQVYCNGVERYDSTITSDIRTGLAASFEITLDEGLNRISITLPGRALSREFQIQSANPYYIGVSLMGDDLSLKFSDEPFGYL